VIIARSASDLPAFLPAVGHEIQGPRTRLLRCSAYSCVRLARKIEKAVPGVRFLVSVVDSHSG